MLAGTPVVAIKVDAIPYPDRGRGNGTTIENIDQTSMVFRLKGENAMNVAVVTSGYLPVPPTKGGAVENIIYNLIRKNEKYGECFFHIFSIEDDYGEDFKNTVVEYIKVSAVSKLMDNVLYFVAKNILRRKHLISYRYFFQRMEFFKTVGKKLNKNEFDRVLLENNIVMFRALRYKNNFIKYKDKIIYHAHNELGKTLGYEKDLTALRKVIGVSDFITSQYRKYINSSVEFETVHNAVDEEAFSKKLSNAEADLLKKNLGINMNYPTLVYTGRISEEKGVLELLKALTVLKTDKYNLLIVGKSFYGTQVKDEFEEELQTIAHSVQGNIIFTGMVKYEEMYKYYKISDLCILPSVWNEPCALTVIECIVSEIPLITTQTGGIPENVTDSTIMLTTQNLIEKLSNAIGELIDNPSKLEELKKKAQKEVYKHGTLDEYYHNFVKALQ